MKFEGMPVLGRVSGATFGPLLGPGEAPESPGFERFCRVKMKSSKVDFMILLLVIILKTIILFTIFKGLYIKDLQLFHPNPLP